MDSRFPANAFDRQDESADANFYTEPRLVAHIDDYAIAAVSEVYRNFLAPSGEYLDLMSSWISHYPSELALATVVGLGMNEVELQRNPRLAEHVVQDLNQQPKLPFADARFDGVTICVSVQYLTRPVEVFTEIGRVLKPGAPLIVTFSNRCFPTKAVRIWQSLADDDHGKLVEGYMEFSGAFAAAEFHDFSPSKTLIGIAEEYHSQVRSGLVYTDPLFAVIGYRRA